MLGRTSALAPRCCRRRRARSHAVASGAAPCCNLVLYPALRRWGIVVTPLRRMGFGIAFSGFAWIAAGAVQLAIDGGDAVSITWQALPYGY